jgi:methylmalonyl-CoA/ethylmalonyl-CoA epimerase
MATNAPRTIPDDKIMIREIAHVCLSVNDVEKTAKAFTEVLGIGPWRISLYKPPMTPTVNGKPTNYVIKFGNAQMGAIRLELVETVEGETCYKDFIKEHGEGIHHIGVPTPLPFDAELQKWEKHGIRTLQANPTGEDTGWAYMDTHGLVGCIVEILSTQR